MIFAFLTRIPAVVWIFVGMVVLSMLLWKQHEQNVELRAAIKTAKEERSHAEAERARLIESDREHSRELARLRQQSTVAGRAIAKIPDDDCLSRDLPAAALDVLRVPASNGKARTPAPSRPPPPASVQRKDLPGRPPVHPGTP